APLGAKLAVESIRQIAAGTIQGIKQDKSLVTKAPKLTKEHGSIDWNLPAFQVCNHIRAMQPWPTAYTYLHRPGQAPLRVIISRAVSLGPPSQPEATPGTASTVNKRCFVGPGLPSLTDNKRLLVGAGDGWLVEVLELQPAGKRRMAAADFLRG